MKDFYVLKKSVKRNILRPSEILSEAEFVDWIDANEKFTWTENTEHGKEWEKVRPIKKKKRAYLNYNYLDEKSFVNLYRSLSGYIKVQFDFRVTYENLLDLIELADQIDCNVWQYKPRRKIVDEEFAKKYKRKSKKGKKEE